jgi:hypothetical protein
MPAKRNDDQSAAPLMVGEHPGRPGWPALLEDGQVVMTSPSRGELERIVAEVERTGTRPWAPAAPSRDEE